MKKLIVIFDNIMWILSILRIQLILSNCLISKKNRLTINELDLHFHQKLCETPSSTPVGLVLNRDPRAAQQSMLPDMYLRVPIGFIYTFVQYE